MPGPNYYAPDAVEVVGLDDYDCRFADLALPMARRDPTQAKKLFIQLIHESPTRRVDHLTVAMSTRWKPALNAFAITFADRMPAAEDR